MRDPNRIPEMIELLREVWQSYPDLRLCQLISNLQTAESVDVYYVEDDVIRERIKQVLLKGW